MLGHSYSEYRSFIAPIATLAVTLAGSDLAEYMPDRMHYTLQEVALTLVASAVNGTFTVGDLVAEFSEPDAKRDVQHWGAGSSPIAGAVLVVRDLVPPSGKVPPWNGVSLKVRQFNIIAHSLKKAVGYLRLVRIYPHLVQVSTGTLSPMKGQPEEFKWPIHFDPSVIAALLSHNCTEKFIPNDLTVIPLAAIPCPIGETDITAVAATFDHFLAKQGIRLSETPVRVEFKLRANADDEESHYEWLGMVWGLDPEDPVGYPSLMVWIPTLGAWRSFRMRLCHPKEIVVTRLKPLLWMICKAVNVMVSCWSRASHMTEMCQLWVMCLISRMTRRWHLLKPGAIECRAMGGQAIMPQLQVWTPLLQILLLQPLALFQITLMLLYGWLANLSKKWSKTGGPPKGIDRFF